MRVWCYYVHTQYACNANAQCEGDNMRETNPGVIADRLADMCNDACDEGERNITLRVEDARNIAILLEELVAQRAQRA